MAYVQVVAVGAPKCDNYTTPLTAFKDLQTFKPDNLVTIYDPFYNDGKAKEYLSATFSNCDIIHEDKDAFTWLPDFDIVITNPPFSIKNKVMDWLVHIDKPFMILLPVNQICNKSFKKLKNFDKMQFIVPNGRYNFEIEGKASNANWFNVLWYCYKCSLPKDINYITS